MHSQTVRKKKAGGQGTGRTGTGRAGAGKLVVSVASKSKEAAAGTALKKASENLVAESGTDDISKTSPAYCNGHLGPDDAGQNGYSGAKLINANGKTGKAKMGSVAKALHSSKDGAGQGPRGRLGPPMFPGASRGLADLAGRRDGSFHSSGGDVRNSFAQTARQGSLELAAGKKDVHILATGLLQQKLAGGLTESATVASNLLAASQAEESLLYLQQATIQGRAGEHRSSADNIPAKDVTTKLHFILGENSDRGVQRRPVSSSGSTAPDDEAVAEDSGWDFSEDLLALEGTDTGLPVAGLASQTGEDVEEILTLAAAVEEKAITRVEGNLGGHPMESSPAVPGEPVQSLHTTAEFTGSALSRIESLHKSFAETAGAVTESIIPSQKLAYEESLSSTVCDHRPTSGEAVMDNWKDQVPNAPPALEMDAMSTTQTSERRDSNDNERRAALPSWSAESSDKFVEHVGDQDCNLDQKKDKRDATTAEMAEPGLKLGLEPGWTAAVSTKMRMAEEEDAAAFFDSAGLDEEELGLDGCGAEITTFHTLSPAPEIRNSLSHGRETNHHESFQEDYPGLTARVTDKNKGVSEAAEQNHLRPPHLHSVAAETFKPQEELDWAVDASEVDAAQFFLSADDQGFASPAEISAVSAPAAPAQPLSVASPNSLNTGSVATLPPALPAEDTGSALTASTEAVWEADEDVAGQLGTSPVVIVEPIAIPSSVAVAVPTPQLHNVPAVSFGVPLDTQDQEWMGTSAVTPEAPFGYQDQNLVSGGNLTSLGCADVDNFWSEEDLKLASESRGEVTPSMLPCVDVSGRSEAADVNSEFKEERMATDGPEAPLFPSEVVSTSEVEPGPVVGTNVHVYTWEAAVPAAGLLEEPAVSRNGDIAPTAVSHVGAAHPDMGGDKRHLDQSFPSGTGSNKKSLSDLFTVSEEASFGVDDFDVLADDEKPQELSIDRAAQATGSLVSVEQQVVQEATVSNAGAVAESLVPEALAEAATWDLSGEARDFQALESPAGTSVWPYSGNDTGEVVDSWPQTCQADGGQGVSWSTGGADQAVWPEDEYRQQWDQGQSEAAVAGMGEAVAVDTSAEEQAQQWQDQYPGWYWDYDAQEWRQTGAQQEVWEGPSAEVSGQDAVYEAVAGTAADGSTVATDSTQMVAAYSSEASTSGNDWWQSEQAQGQLVHDNFWGGQGETETTDWNYYTSADVATEQRAQLLSEFVSSPCEHPEPLQGGAVINTSTGILEEAPKASTDLLPTESLLKAPDVAFEASASDTRTISEASIYEAKGVAHIEDGPTTEAVPEFAGDPEELGELSLGAPPEPASEPLQDQIVAHAEATPAWESSDHAENDDVQSMGQAQSLGSVEISSAMATADSEARLSELGEEPAAGGFLEEVGLPSVDEDYGSIGSAAPSFDEFSIRDTGFTVEPVTEAESERETTAAGLPPEVPEPHADIHTSGALEAMAGSESVLVGQDQAGEELGAGKSQTWGQADSGKGQSWGNSEAAQSTAWEHTEVKESQTWEHAEVRNSQTWDSMDTVGSQAWGQVNIGESQSWDQPSAEGSQGWAQVSVGNIQTWDQPGVAPGYAEGQSGHDWSAWQGARATERVEGNQLWTSEEPQQPEESQSNEGDVQPGGSAEVWSAAQAQSSGVDWWQGDSHTAEADGAPQEDTAEQQAWQDQYPGWYWDYQAQEWKPTADAAEAWDSTVGAAVAEQSAAAVQEVDQGQAPWTGDWQTGQEGTWEQSAWQASQGQGTQLEQHAHVHVPDQSFQQRSWQEYGSQPAQVQLMNAYGQWSSQAYPATQPKMSLPPRTAAEAMKTPDGRPPHTVVAFGFGGRLVLMKPQDPVTLHQTDGLQSTVVPQAWAPGPLRVESLKQAVERGASDAGRGDGSRYFAFLGQRTFAGPLSAGGMSTKELVKWLEERAGKCQEEEADCQNPEPLRLLWGLLRIACQHYGGLRSPVSQAGTAQQDESGPQAALGKLLTAGSGSAEEGRWHSGTHSRSPLLLAGPSSDQTEASAREVKGLLMVGRRKEALLAARNAQLWGLALMLARQLGEKAYLETMADMAQQQFSLGTPLRTLSLLMAAQPADVFSSKAGSQTLVPVSVRDVGEEMDPGLQAMLEDWKGNLAVMAANRTGGDERVIIHLGDCLWRARGEVVAAHICYLVADCTLEPYSSTSRLCLVGADHWKSPRTFATVQAIQRTEVYEYARLLGNPQQVLPAFQPYKLAYAAMLVEAGRPQDARRYCEAVSKALRMAGRSAQVEACRQAALGLEERLKIHLQGGPAGVRSIIGKAKTALDWGAGWFIGSTAASTPATAAAASLESPIAGLLGTAGSFGARANMPSFGSGSHLASAASMEASVPVSYSAPDLTAQASFFMPGNIMTGHVGHAAEPATVPLHGAPAVPAHVPQRAVSMGSGFGSGLLQAAGSASAPSPSLGMGAVVHSFEPRAEPRKQGSQLANSPPISQAAVPLALPHQADGATNASGPGSQAEALRNMHPAGAGAVPAVGSRTEQVAEARPSLQPAAADTRADFGKAQEPAGLPAVSETEPAILEPAAPKPEGNSGSGKKSNERRGIRGFLGFGRGSTVVPEEKPAAAPPSMSASASMDPVSSEGSDSRERPMLPARSVSEPDFSRQGKPGPTLSESASSVRGTPPKQLESTASGGVIRSVSSLFSRALGTLGTQAKHKQAKLGDSSSFYYDEKLKRWVDKNADPVEEVKPVGPPPKMGFAPPPSTEVATGHAGPPGALPPLAPDSSPAVSSAPPLPAGSTFTARRGGVRSRYVDTFNKSGSSGGGSSGATAAVLPGTLPTAGPPKPPMKFFVPAAPPPAAASQDFSAASGTQGSTEGQAGGQPSALAADGNQIGKEDGLAGKEAITPPGGSGQLRSPSLAASHLPGRPQRVDDSGRANGIHGQKVPVGSESWTGQEMRVQQQGGYFAGQQLGLSGSHSQREPFGLALGGPPLPPPVEPNFVSGQDGFGSGAPGAFLPTVAETAHADELQEVEL